MDKKGKIIAALKRRLAKNALAPMNCQLTSLLTLDLP